MLAFPAWHVACSLVQRTRSPHPMQLPFTTEQFFDLLAAYNEALWPGLAVLWMASLIASLLLFSSRRPSDRWLSGLLAPIGSGRPWHTTPRSLRESTRRVVFAALFLLLARCFSGGVVQQDLSFAPWRNAWAPVAWVLIAYCRVLRHQCRATFQRRANPSVRRPMPDNDLHGRRADARHPTIVASVGHSGDLVCHRRVGGVPAGAPITPSQSQVLHWRSSRRRGAATPGDREMR